MTRPTRPRPQARCSQRTARPKAVILDSGRARGPVPGGSGLAREEHHDDHDEHARDQGQRAGQEADHQRAQAFRAQRTAVVGPRRGRQREEGGSHGRPHYNECRRARSHEPPRITRAPAHPRRHLRRGQHAPAHELRHHRRASGHARARRQPGAGGGGGAAGAGAARSAPGARRRLHREHGHARALPPLPAGEPGDHRRGGDRRDRALAARLQPAGGPVEPRRSRGARRAPPGARGRARGRRHLELQRLGAVHPRGDRARRASRLHHRLLGGGRGEARPAHLPPGAARGRRRARRRRSTSAISTRWTSWARARPGSTASCSIRAASGRRATAAWRAGSTRRCGWRWRSRTPTPHPALFGERDYVGSVT